MFEMSRTRSGRSSHALKNDDVPAGSHNVDVSVSRSAPPGLARQGGAELCDPTPQSSLNSKAGRVVLTEIAETASHAASQRLCKFEADEILCPISLPLPALAALAPPPSLPFSVGSICAAGGCVAAVSGAPTLSVSSCQAGSQCLPAAAPVGSFSCRFCCQSFSDLSCLCEHLRHAHDPQLHTDELALALGARRCKKGCGLLFKNLQGHKCHKHRVAASLVAAQPAAPSLPAVLSAVATLSCGVALASKSSEALLLQQLPPGAEPVRCPVCSVSLPSSTRKTDLCLHIRTSHGPWEISDAAISELSLQRCGKCHFVFAGLSGHRCGGPKPFRWLSR